MRKRFALAWLMCWVPCSGNAQAVETRLSGWIALEGRGFFSAPLLEEQDRHGGSVSIQTDFRATWDTDLSFTLIPFVQLDSGYEQQPRRDLRECSVTLREDAWHLRIGIGRVTWGAMDVIHLVDVINQRERFDLLDNSEKLGQPMLEISIQPGIGTATFYALPYFREMPFPGPRGRVRPTRPVDTDRPLYESGSRQDTVDLAARYSHTVGSLDFGVHFFLGRNRTPFLIPEEMIPAALREPSSSTDPIGVPFYENMTQFGVEAQWARSGWLWKLEALHRAGFFDRYFAAVGGFEHTRHGWAGTRADLSVLAEYAYDERGKSLPAMTLFDHDLFLGFRLALGDLADTTVQAGALVDLDTAETVGSLQAHRRMGSFSRLGLEAWFLMNAPSDSFLHAFRREDHVRVRWTMNF